MKVAICYPPLDTRKGIPLLSQNRQFQYFKEPTYIYPVVPAQAATLLKDAGHEVAWLDAIAEGWSYPEFLDRLKQVEPDLIAMETKTPVVKQHWQIIDDLKSFTSLGVKPLTVLFGDHVTALPQESFERSSVDFVLTGGDYDFLLANLCGVLERLRPSGPSAKPQDWLNLLTGQAAALEPGIWYRYDDAVKNTGQFKLEHDLDVLPFIDRELTRWELYAYKNGNFRTTPGTYIMSGRDCWYRRDGGCTFCSWPTLYPQFRSKSPGLVLNEVEDLVNKVGVKEIMDDSGSFPTGEWLDEFCEGMIRRGLHRRVFLDCNMRFGALNDRQYRQMKEAGFRLVLFGLESANQKTLDKVNKNVTVEEIIVSCKSARAAGLYPHITIMFGYPWESFDEAQRTLELGKWLLKKGYAYTVQATIVIPYPGSRLFAQCRDDGLLRSLDWDDYDMKKPVMKSKIDDAAIRGLVQGIYQVAFSPEFIARRILSVRDMADLKYFQRGIGKVFGHIFDFGGRHN